MRAPKKSARSEHNVPYNRQTSEERLQHHFRGLQRHLRGMEECVQKPEKKSEKVFVIVKIDSDDIHGSKTYVEIFSNYEDAKTRALDLQSQVKECCDGCKFKEEYNDEGDLWWWNGIDDLEGRHSIEIKEVEVQR